MFPIIFLAAAAYQATLTLPLATPLYCLDSKDIYQPIERADYGRLRKTFARQFGFGGHLSQSSPTTGTLLFRGRANRTESISYSIEAHDGEVGQGMTLVAMRVRLRGLVQNLSGDDLCWKTFEIINGG